MARDDFAWAERLASGELLPGTEHLATSTAGVASRREVVPDPVRGPAVPEPSSPALADARRRSDAVARALAARRGVAMPGDQPPWVLAAHALAPLTTIGHHLLVDRTAPTRRRRQAELVVVGEGGVFMVDTETAAGVRVEGDVVLRGQQDITDDVLALADVAYRAEGDLVEVGLVPGEVRPVLVLAGQEGVDHRIGSVRVVGERDVLRFVASHGTRLTPRQVDVVLGRVLEMRPELEAAPVGPDAPREAAVPAPRDGHSPRAVLSEREVADALMAGSLAAPVESWMTFLHPTQASLVRRSFNGPCRIRGASGTGKTLVGLHRAAYLARSRPGTVLVTSLVRTLPDVLAHQLALLAPDVVDRVELTGVHEWTRRLLAERGVRVAVDESEARLAFDEAFQALPADSPLHRADVGPGYWRTEIGKVIKGRGMADLAEYVAAARTGRRYPLAFEQRRAVWELYEGYQARLAAAGIHDADDLILLATEALRRDPLDGAYSAVVVDEAQDLSAATVRMLHSLVGDSRDGLTLIGDGQQAVYPGGYTLAEAGVSVLGRGVVLDVNFRNTAPIVDLALRVVEGDEFTDLEGGLETPTRPRLVTRTGPDPVVQRFDSMRERYVGMIGRARTVARGTGADHGGVAVLCSTNGAAVLAADALRAAGEEVVLLTEYDGTQAQPIKVGTIKRAKGLEFSQVLLPDVPAALIDASEPPSAAADREWWELQRRELYSAMTRARDGLWVGVV
jgi:superfamily I DNA/RNA helicase